MENRFLKFLPKTALGSFVFGFIVCFVFLLPVVFDFDETGERSNRAAMYQWEDESAVPDENSLNACLSANEEFAAANTECRSVNTDLATKNAGLVSENDRVNRVALECLTANETLSKQNKYFAGLLEEAGYDIDY